jgi:hypothetical protein
MSKPEVKTSDTAKSNAIDMTAMEIELRPRSTEDLKFVFHECYAGAANFIAKAAVCVKLLQERGENLHGIPLVGTFRRIATGQIVPELVWKYHDSPNRHIVERLPLDDQRRLVREETIEVVEPKTEGGFTKRMVDLTTAPTDVARLVIGPAGIRSLEDQMAYLGAQKARPIARKRSDEQEGSDMPQEPLTHQINVKLTDSEYQALRIKAAMNKIPENKMARRFMISTEALKPLKT